MDFLLGIVLLFGSGIGFGVLGSLAYVTSKGWER